MSQATQVITKSESMFRATPTLPFVYSYIYRLTNSYTLALA